MLEGFKILDYPEKEKQYDNDWIGKGKNWHYVNSRHVWTAAKTESRFRIPDGMFWTMFKGYKSVCAIRHIDRESHDVTLKLCAVPSAGGPYLILDDEFSEELLPMMQSEEGLKRILANALLSDISQLEKRGLEIVDRPGEPCIFCDADSIEEGLRDKNKDEVYCGPLCFLYAKEL
jgi:hypothetical protein